MQDLLQQHGSRQDDRHLALAEINEENANALQPTEASLHTTYIPISAGPVGRFMHAAGAFHHLCWSSETLTICVLVNLILQLWT
jgi:hypothetical protein